MKAPPPPVRPSTKPVSSPRSTIPDLVPLSITTSADEGSDRIVIYGTGGVGKTTLAAYAPAPFFFDLEWSTKKMAVAKDREIPDWLTLRGKLAAFAQNPPQGIRSIVIDSATKAQELAVEHVVQTRKTEKGEYVDGIEGFGWNKGWGFVCDEMTALLADLDRIASLGFNILVTAHDVPALTPHPEGADFLRWEPMLYAGDKNRKADIRSLFKNWCEHLLFVSYDVFVDPKTGKAIGSGTRTISTQQLGTHVAKSRTVQGAFPFDIQDPGAVWNTLGIQ